MPTSDGWTWCCGDVRAMFTSRESGVSQAPYDSLNLGVHVGDEFDRVLENRRLAAQLVGLTPDRVAGVMQMHGADVWMDLGRAGPLPADVRWDEGSSPIEADALVSTRAGIALSVGVADCLPIAIAWGPAIAAVHAGWRGLDAGVVEATLAVMRRAIGSVAAVADERPRSVIGPSLGPCCFEVGEEVAARFADSSIRWTDGALPHLDARAEARRRLEAFGAVVDVIDVCTRCDPRCFSHRGDGGITGRQAVLVHRRADAEPVG